MTTEEPEDLRYPQNKAGPIRNDWNKGYGPYRTGDGEVVAHPRPGSMHAYTLPSRGMPT